MDVNHLWHILQSKLDIIKKEVDDTHHQVIDKSFDAMKEAITQFLSEQVIAGLAHPHPRSRVYRAEPKQWKIKDVAPPQLFDLIVSKARGHEKPACVFDLDGTLFDTSTRTLNIIHEWVASEGAKKFDKIMVKKAAKITYHHIGYSIAHAFENAGFDLRDKAVMDIFLPLEKYWKDKFFDGVSLLQYDLLIQNSNNFVNRILDEGVEIFYLTGRHLHKMYNGTVDQLKKWDFPLKTENLILKKIPHTDDQIFKAEAIKKIAQEYDVIANFENEYLNIAYMALEVPNAIHVIMDSQHSGRPPPELEVPVYRIDGF